MSKEEIEGKEHIENALYATSRFLTSEASDLAESIIEYLNDEGFTIAKQSQPPPKSAEELAKLFHYTYEELAPKFGYETKKETKEFDSNTPNGKLMIAVCDIIQQRLAAQPNDLVCYVLNCGNKPEQKSAYCNEHSEFEEKINHPDK